MSYVSTGSVGIALGTGAVAAGSGLLGGTLKSNIGTYNNNILASSSSSFAVAGVCAKSYFSQPMHIGGMVGGALGLGAILGLGTPSVLTSVAITSFSSALGQEVIDSSVPEINFDTQSVDFSSYDSII